LGRVPALLLLLFATAVLPAAAQARVNVLIVFDEDSALPGLAIIDRNLRQAMRTELKDDVDFYDESLQLSRFKGPGYDSTLREHFRRKYAGKQLDLIVAVMAPSLDFLVRHGEALFPGVPIVFCGAEPSDINRKVLRPNVTGILLERDFAPTLEAALRLQPGTREVFVVGGTSGFDRHLQAIARPQLQPFENRVRIHWLTTQPMGVLVPTLSRLPANSIVYYLTLFADGAGDAYVPHEAVSRIAKAANAPVYVALDQYVGLGAVGGNVYSVGTHGQQTADIGLRILRGEPPSSIPVVALSAQSNMFDWRELQRWGLDERRLPAGSVVDFRAPTLWGLYKWPVTLGVTLFLLQTLLVVGLLVNRTQRLRAEKEVHRQRDELAHAQRVATLGELTASIAHELRQPLTAITANVQAARKMLAVDHARQDIDEALADVGSEAGRAAETITRLRGLFRKEPVTRAPVDLNGLLDDALRLLTANLSSRRIAVQLMRSELPVIRGDAIQLRQVLINLLVNAQDAIVAAEDGPREIWIETSRPDESSVAVAIRDSGVGVDEAALQRIFEHFVSSKPQGLGLGLVISRSIVEAHGGKIWATRNAGRGLTLHVQLPISR